MKNICGLAFVWIAFRITVWKSNERTKARVFLLKLHLQKFGRNSRANYIFLCFLRVSLHLESKSDRSTLEQTFFWHQICYSRLLNGLWKPKFLTRVRPHVEMGRDGDDQSNRSGERQLYQKIIKWQIINIHNNQYLIIVNLKRVKEINILALLFYNRY